MIRDTTKIINPEISRASESPFILSSPSVLGNDLLKMPTTNFTNMLAGQIPGLTVLTRDGEPGNDKSILLVHGINSLYASEPLIVVDGILNRSIERLEASDIESITLLKDASAAIYGGRAANGVLLITTKHGTIGKPQITFNFNQGLSQPTVIPEMANSATYAAMLNEISAYRGGSPIYSSEEIQKFENGSDPLRYQNTDWFGTVLKKYSVQNSLNATLTGGKRQFKYYGSAGTKYQDGIYRNGALNYRLNNVRLNLDGNLGKSIQIGFYLNFRQEINNMPTSSKATIFRSIMSASSNKPAFWYDGKPNSDFEYGDNPAVITTNETGTNKQTSNALESAIRIKLDVPFISGMSINSNVAFDRETKKHMTFQKPWYLYSWNGTNDVSGLPVLTENKVGLYFPQLSNDNYEFNQTTLNLSVNYHKAFENKHFVDVIIEGTIIQNKDSHDFNDVRYKTDILIDPTTMHYGTLNSNYNYLNYYGQVNYSYLGKCLIGLTLSRSKSPYLPNKSNQLLFPTLSMAWLMSEESLMKNKFSFLNRFKIYGSYGKTGTDFVPGQYLNSNSLPNPDLTWELSTQAAIGFESQFLNNKFSVEANYFYNHRTSIPMVRNSSGGGMNLPLENIGNLINQGVDYALNYRNKLGDFDITVYLNGSYQINKLEFIDESPGIPEYQQLTGNPVFAQLYYKQLGVFKNQAEIDAYPHWAGARPGDIIFADINDDKKIDGLDRLRTDKSEYPVFTGGLKLLVAYKRFDLSVLFQGSAGAQRNIYLEAGESGNYLQDFAENRWTGQNTSSTTPRTYNKQNVYWTSQSNTYWLRNSDFLRLKFLEIGFNFSSKLIDQIKFKEMRVYFNGFNLLTFDQVKIIDPEYTSAYSYPLSRIFNLGVKCTF